MDPNSLKRWMADLRQDYMNANMEDGLDEEDKESEMAGYESESEDVEESDSIEDEWQ